MMSRVLVPIGRWKVDVKSTNGQAAISLSGRALSDSAQPARVHGFVLTAAQAHELVSGLNQALTELELQRTAALARAADGAG
jgi:hypothetical protein